MVYAILNNALWEVTPKQAYMDRSLIVTWQAAHKWVRAGLVHHTPLWIDDAGRVRRATNNS